MTRWRIERWRPERVRALEVWNLPYRGKVLYERLGAPFIEDARIAGRSDAQIDRELAEAFAHLVNERAPAANVFVSGGLCLRRGFLSLLSSMPRVTIDPEPQFPGEAGAREELRRRGVDQGLLVDVGQTSIKLSQFGGRGARVIRDRPRSLVRHFTEREQPSVEEAREQANAFSDWLSGAIAESLGNARAIVLGLPCALDDFGIPGACTYAGWAGDAGFVARMLAKIDLHSDASIDVLLVNDAELAAASALASDENFRGLAVTLGFGPGAAWAGE